MTAVNPSAPFSDAHPGIGVDVPEAVAPGAVFEIVVGLSYQAQAGVQGAAMHIAVPQPNQPRELTIQVKAENFTLDTMRYPLPFDPADLAKAEVRIPITAPAVADTWRGRIEVEYSQNGLLIGTAWREILVAPDAPAQAPTSTSGGEVAVNLDQTVPIDLTVSISRGEAAGTFLWTFTTPHPVQLPDEQVITHLEQDTAETFALRKIREMAQVDGNPTAGLRIAGVATEVAGVMPLWFWKVLAPVWRIAKDAGRLPTLLLVLAGVLLATRALDGGTRGELGSLASKLAQAERVVVYALTPTDGPRFRVPGGPQELLLLLHLELPPTPEVTAPPASYRFGVIATLRGPDGGALWERTLTLRTRQTRSGRRDAGWDHEAAFVPGGQLALSDSGSLELDGALITELLDLGVAGFPSIIVTRRAVGSAAIAAGRVDLVLSSKVEHFVDIAGLTSCSADSDCPDGQTCQDDLTCK